MDEKLKEERKQERLNIICSATGWTEKRAKAEMKRAKEMGLSNVHYVKYECWKMSTAEIRELAKKQEKLKVQRQERINAVCESTGWDEEKAKGELARAKKLGWKETAYVRHEGWKLTDEEIVALIEKQEKLAKKKEQRQQRLAVICEATGWNEEKADAELTRVKNLGLKETAYVRHEGWKLSEAELQGLIEKLEKAARRKALRQQRIAVICEATGWGEEKADAELVRVKALGLKESSYVRHEGWNLSEVELQELIENIEKAARRKALRQQRIAVICEATGWDEEKAKADIERAKALGMSTSAYIRGEGWEMTDEEITALIERQERARVRRQQRIAQVRESTGWSEEQVVDEMDRVKKMGFSHIEYINNECWKLTDEEILILIGRRDKIKVRKDELKNPIKFVCDRSGWTESEAKARMDAATSLGITYQQYADMEMYDLSDAEVEEFAEILKAKAALAAEDKRFYTEVVAEKSGWSIEKATFEVDKAEERGVTALQYAQKGCWQRDEEAFERIIRVLARENSVEETTKEIFLEKIMATNDWSRAKAELKVNRAESICGSSYEGYSSCKLYELTEEEQMTYVTLGLFSKVRVKYNDYFKANETLNDKSMFNRIFADCIHRKWFVNRDISYEEFLENIRGLDAIIVKPLTATQGKGIQKLNCNVSDEEKKELYNRILDQRISIVEEYIVQHDALKAFCDTSVNTVRITTLNANGKCNFLYALLRTGCGGVADNMHAGGVASAIDMETGITETNAVDMVGNIYEANPYSGLKIKGFQIPHWDKIIDTCEKIYNRIEDVNLIGWDFALTPEGVDLIEGNPGASYLGAQIPYAEEKRGLRAVMVDPFV